MTKHNPTDKAACGKNTDTGAKIFSRHKAAVTPTTPANHHLESTQQRNARQERINAIHKNETQNTKHFKMIWSQSCFCLSIVFRDIQQLQALEFVPRPLLFRNKVCELGIENVDKYTK